VGATAILPRRSFTPVVGRLLHDRTADKMAAAISRIPHAAATIVPFDVRSRVESLSSKGLAAKPAAVADSATAVSADGERQEAAAVVAPERADEPIAEEVTAPAASGRYERPTPGRGVTPIGELTKPGRAIAEGRVHTVEIRPVEHNTVLACDVEDSTGQLTALFYGRSNIAGLRPGSKVRLRGQVGIRENRPVMINPAYELLAPGSDDYS
jgi:hypothetical protein